MGKNIQQEVLINGIKVGITSPDKPLWPNLDILKLHYLEYLAKMAPFLLPFLQNRALTVIRYPHGAGDERFYQKLPGLCSRFCGDCIRGRNSLYRL